MKEADQLISGIDLKIRKLIEQLRRKETENNDLLNEIKILNETINNHKEQIRTLEEKNRILKVSKTLENSNESVEVKNKITELVREIDRCISLLNK